MTESGYKPEHYRYYYGKHGLIRVGDSGVEKRTSGKTWIAAPEVRKLGRPIKDYNDFDWADCSVRWSAEAEAAGY